MARRLKQSDAGFDDAFEVLVAAGRDIDDEVDEIVAAIIADVRARGDAALLELTAKFDRFVVENVSALFVPPRDIVAARSLCDAAAIEALELAADRIDSYHRHQIPADFDYTDETGVRLGARWLPISSVGIYVPGGTAAYPSSVLMNGIPARVAGVEKLTMVVPAPDGILNPLILAAAGIVGIQDIIRIGGAHAVAALAYGTDSVASVDKIVGPGNAYVAAAKRRVFGIVGIDMVAGPSEILVVADSDNEPAWIAADLLSQAEHDECAQSVLVCDSADFADKVAVWVTDHLSRLPRSSIARASWENHGVIIIVEDVYSAAPLIDQLAPEHLELAIADPDRLAARVKNAGAIFFGRFAPEAIGDYLAGPSHVLPTSRSARFSSGLGVPDFLKRTSIIGCDAASLSAIGPAAAGLALAEGLDAHALSVTLRTGAKRKP